MKRVLLRMVKVSGSKDENSRVLVSKWNFYLNVYEEPFLPNLKEDRMFRQASSDLTDISISIESLTLSNKPSKQSQYERFK